ncbi:MAG: hypothetical protein ACOH16_05745 [Propionibacteriaceae bacterium]
MREWSRKRWVAAVIAALLTVLVVAIPTAMIPTPIFGREVGVTWWSWPALVVTAVLSGLVFATYVREPGAAPATSEVDKPSRFGMAGGVLTFFAVGCPVCNKIVLLALGASGAMTWFAPVQPVIAALAVALLGYSLKVRLAGERACPVPATVAS